MISLMHRHLLSDPSFDKDRTILARFLRGKAFGTGLACRHGRSHRDVGHGEPAHARDEVGEFRHAPGTHV
jgi:hypothetical protein